MANKEGFAEKVSEKVRNAGIIAAVLGSVLWLANSVLPYEALRRGGEYLVVGGLLAAGIGEVGKRATKEK